MKLGDGQPFKEVPGTGRECRSVRAGFQVFSRPECPIEPLLNHLLPDPERIIARGEVFKKGSRNHSVKIVLEGDAYFLKRYNDRGWGYRLGNIFRQSRAVRTWRVHLEFMRLGVPIQPPLLCLEERKFRLLGRSYLLTGFISDAHSLHEAWPLINDKDKVQLLRHLADCFGRMHRAGALHGDLKWYNILIRRTGSEWAPVLVDLDGGALVPTFSARMALQDIDRFMRDLREHEPNSGLVSIFEEAWREQTGI